MPVAKITTDNADKILSLIKDIYNLARLPQPEVIKNEYTCVPNSAECDFIDEDNAENIYATLFNILFEYANRTMQDYDKFEELLALFFTINTSADQLLKDILSTIPSANKNSRILAIALEFPWILWNLNGEHPNIKQVQNVISIHALSDLECINDLGKNKPFSVLKILIFISGLQYKPVLQPTNLSQLINIINHCREQAKDMLDTAKAVDRVRQAELSLKSLLLNTLKSPNILQANETLNLLDSLYSVYNPLSFEKVLFRAAIDHLLRTDDQSVHAMIQQRYGCSPTVLAVKNLHFMEKTKDDALDTWANLPTAANAAQSAYQRLKVKFE